VPNVTLSCAAALPPQATVKTAAAPHIQIPRISSSPAAQVKLGG